MSDDEPMDEGPEEEPRERTLPPASEKQIKFIKALQAKLGLSDADLNELVDEVTGRGFDDMTVRNASEVIDEIKIKGREMGVDLDAQPKASDKQVGFIKSLKRRALLTAAEFEELLQDKGGVSTPEELGKRDASAVIDELKKLEKQGGKRGGSVTKPKTKVEDDGNYDDDVPF